MKIYTSTLAILWPVALSTQSKHLSFSVPENSQESLLLQVGFFLSTNDHGESCNQILSTLQLSGGRATNLASSANVEYDRRGRHRVKCA